jgi:pimeloyl-ACP methyl ester carboxylesterase
VRVEVNGSGLWFDVDGPVLEPAGSEMRTRPTVVFLHGGPGSFDHSYFKTDFSRLTALAQIVYLDLPGHGRSEWGPAEEWSFEQAGDTVRAFCDMLGIVDPIVLGHSFGGPVAIAYTSRNPDYPGGLILQSTMAHFDLDRVVEGFRKLAGDEVADIVRGPTWAIQASPTMSGPAAGDCLASGYRCAGEVEDHA